MMGVSSLTNGKCRLDSNRRGTWNIIDVPKVVVGSRCSLDAVLSGSGSALCGRLLRDRSLCRVVGPTSV